MNLVSPLAVAGGAGVGALIRWMLGLALDAVFPSIPLGTLVANLLGGFLMAVGLFMLLSPDLKFFLAGLAVIVAGNGLFKPNISTMIGKLYAPGDARRDSGFTIFYMGINLGAFFAPLISGTLAEKIDFKWGFLAAGIGMVIGLLTFMLQKNKLLVDHDNKPIGMPTNKFGIAQVAMVLGSIAVIFFLMNFKTMFQSDWDIIGYLIYGAMIVMPLIVLTDKS